MAITPVSSGENATVTGTNPYTWTVDIGTRTNGLLVIGVIVIAGVSRTISSATWNGVAMSIAAQRTDELAASVFHLNGLLYLANPANGSNTFSVTLSGTTASLWFCASWYDGVLQASPLDQTSSTTGATDPSASVTPTENDEVIVANYTSEAANVLTPGGSPATITEWQNHDFGPRVCGDGYVLQTTAGAQTMAWAGTDDNWNMVIGTFKAAATVTTVRNQGYIF